MSVRLLESLQRQHPNLFFLTLDREAELETYLRRRELLKTGERLASVERAGDGNMNCTLRVQTNFQSLIVKQSRPWVEKYPTIPAPWDRALSEAQFYLLVSPEQSISRQMPNLLHLDAESRVIVLEDLGPSADFTGVYGDAVLSVDEASALGAWLGELHATTFNEPARQGLGNLEMRRLNHEHLFRFPLEPDNGLDLEAITPGLSQSAQHLKTNADYVAEVHRLGERYLSDGQTLLHGDFFPGSWLQHRAGPKIIDPEFAFFGDAEFDLGVLLAHLYLARQPEQVHEAVLQGYKPPAGFDIRLALRYSGVEVMRRLIGVAQLPLQLNLTAKQTLLQLSCDLVTSADLLKSTRLPGSRQMKAWQDARGDDSDARCA